MNMKIVLKNLIKKLAKNIFYGLLKDEHTIDKDYDYAKRVWDKSAMKTVGYQHDFYLKTDFLLLADVFKQFRKTYLQYQTLDPCHYFSSSGLSWGATLKITDVKLELMAYIDLYQFIEKGTRSGVSYKVKKTMNT